MRNAFHGNMQVLWFYNDKVRQFDDDKRTDTHVRERYKSQLLIADRLARESAQFLHDRGVDISEG